MYHPGTVFTQKLNLKPDITVIIVSYNTITEYNESTLIQCLLKQTNNSNASAHIIYHEYESVAKLSWEVCHISSRDSPSNHILQSSRSSRVLLQSLYI